MTKTYVWTYKGKTVDQLTVDECREALLWYTSDNFHMEQCRRNADLSVNNARLQGALESLQLKYEELLVRHTQSLCAVRI